MKVLQFYIFIYFHESFQRKIKNEFKRFEEQNKSARYAKTLEQTAVKLEGTEKDLKLAREETRQTRSMLKENETKLTEATNENKKVKKKLEAQSGRLTETEKKQKETEEKLRQAHDRITKTEADSASYQAELAKISEDLSKEKGRLNEREEELRMVTEVVRKLIQDQVRRKNCSYNGSTVLRMPCKLCNQSSILISNVYCVMIFLVVYIQKTLAWIHTSADSQFQVIMDLYLYYASSSGPLPNPQSDTQVISNSRCSTNC